MKTIQECLDWFANRKRERDPLFDFNRRLPRNCADCGYPFGTKPPYRLSWTECPIHQPSHWKHHERKAQEVAKATDRAEMLMKEVRK